MIPALVGFVFTFLINKSAFGQINPATIKYAADEISPGTFIFWPISLEEPSIEAVRPLVLIFAPNPESISSVWLREITGSDTDVTPSAYKPAKSTQDFTWADATGEL